MITLKEAARRYKHFMKDPDKVVKIKPTFEQQYLNTPTKKETECPHCKFIDTLGPIQSNREHWIITEIFVYLHNGKDYCDWRKK